MSTPRWCAVAMRQLIWPALWLLGACADPGTPDGRGAPVGGLSSLAGHDLELAVRGHQEIAIEPGGRLLPWVVDLATPLELCLRTRPDTPTSSWQAHLWLDDEGPRSERMESEPTTVFADPTSRLDTTLCFSFALPREPARRDLLALCAVVRDAYDGARLPLPCQPLTLRDDGGARHRLDQALGLVLRDAATAGLATLLGALDNLAEQARAAALPFLALRIELVAVHYLRQAGSAETLAEASRRLAQPPPWLERPEAMGWRAKWEYERALLAMASGWDLRAAWRHLAVADQLSLRLLHPFRLTVRMKQAEILARVGALREAIDRLATALDDCAAMACREELVPSAHGMLGWLLTLDPLADDDDLEQARGHLAIALEGARGDSLETANQQLNLSYLALRRGESPRAALQATRGALADPRLEGSRVEQLLGWSHLIEGLAALAEGRASVALAACGRARSRQLPRLAAWASECQGRAYRDLGALDDAREAFETALLLLDHATPERLGQALSLGLGRRAETFYRTARLEVERADPGAAWELLARLDMLAADDALAGRCATPAPAELALRDTLLQALMGLDGPASGRERRQRVSMQRALREQLDELVRRRPGCDGSPGPDAGAVALPEDPDATLGHGPEVRAFVVDDEVLVLRHRGARPGEGVELASRRPWPRQQRLALLEQLAEALEQRRLDDGAWRRLVAPLCEVLACDTLVGPARPLDGPPPVVTFALHGELQGVPLAALPLADGRWLGDRLIPAVWPGASERNAVGPGAVGQVVAGRDAAPLLVVDPGGDLPAGRELLAFYRGQFPAAQLLTGERADRAAFRAALPTARWLHVDAHGVYDAAFPDLSSLVLADGPLILAELAELPSRLSFANLSGCRTGRWPITADSGRFGLAGLLARRGAGWVVATRDDLEDRLAGAYNRVFYRWLAAGSPVPLAHARAMAEVRGRFPAVTWASLLLLRGVSEDSLPAGQNDVATTPSKGEGASMDGDATAEARSQDPRAPGSFDPGGEG